MISEKTKKTIEISSMGYSGTGEELENYFFYYFENMVKTTQKFELTGKKVINNILKDYKDSWVINDVKKLDSEGDIEKVQQNILYKMPDGYPAVDFLFYENECLNYIQITKSDFYPRKFTRLSY